MRALLFDLLTSAAGFRYRVRSELITVASCSGVCHSHTTAHTFDRAPVLPGTLHSAPSAGGGRPWMGCGVGGRVVRGGECGDNVGVLV